MAIKKYFIFGIEVIAIVLWLLFGAQNTLTAVLGVLVIILLSQVAHHLFHAR